MIFTHSLTRGVAINNPSKSSSDIGNDGPELALFLLVGGSAALAFSITAGLLAGFGLQPWMAGSTAYACVIPLAYLGQKRLTFKSNAKHAIALPRYIATQLTALLSSAVFAELVFGLTDINTYVGFIIISGPIALVNFLILKLWTFANHGQAN